MKPQTVQPVPTGCGRKKRKNVEHWKRTKAKILRYSSPGLSPPPTCKHRSSEAYQCEKVKLQDIRRFHQNLYSTPDRTTQNNFILRHITVETPKRKRPRVQNLDSVTHNKVVTTKYCMPMHEYGLDGSEICSNVPVCKNLFISSLCVSRDRIQLLAKKYLVSGFAPQKLEEATGNLNCLLKKEKV